MTRTALYRHFAADGAMLYVGITDCLSERDKQHAATADWHHLVHRTETQWCVSREHALALEAVAVRFEIPAYNKSNATRAGGVISSSDRRDEFLAEIEACAMTAGMSAASLCRKATGNPRFLERMKRRAQQLEDDIARVRSFISATP